MKNTLNPLAAALSMGLLWAVSLFLLTLLSLANGFGSDWLQFLKDIYPWYEISIKGAFIGLVWGFLDGLIGTYILVWLYNFFVKKLSK